jgi:hypothetical protein
VVSGNLQEWLGELLPDVPVTLAVGADPAGFSGIAIRLLAIAPRVVPLNPGRRSAALALDYLVTVQLDDARAAHAAVSEIAFAVLDGGAYELVADRSAGEWCTALGMTPSPGLVLRTELRRDTRVPLAPLVREAPRPSLEPLVHARGRVVGPGNMPIAGALVTIAGTSRCSTTGPDGRFRFAIPAGQPATVTARARSREVSASLAPETETILTLQMEA